jgi:hypothetical protein
MKFQGHRGILLVMEVLPFIVRPLQAKLRAEESQPGRQREIPAIRS